MCAIFGIGLLEDSSAPPEMIKLILRELIEHSDVRGGDATGLTFTTKKEVNIVKHNIAAKEFIDLPEFNTELNKFIGNNPTDQVYSILGHCRFKTKGTQTNPLNNHPIATGNIVGIHNGMISNDDTLFDTYAKFKPGIKRKAQVDSEIIFSLINYYSDIYSVMSNYPTTKAIVKTSQLLKGSYACGVVDAKSPENIWIFRNYNPVVINYFKKTGLILFASTDRILRDSIELVDLEEPEIIDVQQQMGVCFNIVEKNYHLFDLESSYTTNSR